MKKSVIVLCFALCGTLAFAQTKHAPARTMQKTQNVAAIQTRDNIREAKPNYKASIFNTKAGGDVLMQCDFGTENTGYSTGTIGAGQTIINPSGSSENLAAHGYTFNCDKWMRIADTNQSTLNALAGLECAQGGYPVLFGYFFDGVGASYTLSNMFKSTTPDNGFMLMSMIDSYQGWGGHGLDANYDAYIQFPAFATTGAPLVVLEMYQYYRKFNRDYCYVDYNTGSGWHYMEINVRGVDVDVNSNLRGTLRANLPTACANVASLELRVRWACNQGDGGSYWWMIDDVQVVEAFDNELRLTQNLYEIGTYHMIPQNFETPLTWYANILNSGANDQATVTVAVNHLDANYSNMTQVGSKTYSNLASNESGEFYVDGMGTANDGFSVLSTPNTTANLPVAETGDHFVFASYSAANVPAANLDTIGYMVNALQNDPEGKGQYAVWALDNGFLTPLSYWAEGRTYENNQWYGTDDYGSDNPSYTKPGYSAWNRFVTGPNVPNGWVIRGMQIVAATRSGINVAPMSHISADLMYDVFATDTSSSFSLSTISTGAVQYETKVSDFNYYNNDMSHFSYAQMNAQEYMEPGDYNVINILFPQQPALQPRTSYRLGYQLDDGYFAPAAQVSYYAHHYDGDPDSVRYTNYMANDTINNTKKYGNTWHPGSGYNQFVYDPDQQKISWGFVFDYPPMIRMLVGPSYTYPTHNVTIQCEGEGGAAYYGDSDDDQCGQTLSMVEGSNQVYFEAEAGYQVLELYVDGVSVMIDTTDAAFDETVVYRYTYNESDVVRYTFPNLTEDATIRVVFGERQGIDKAAANVKMNLFPNPANNNVQLSIAGVNGTVNCAILDMSGRVVYNQNINAEATTNINLSNLAKGAYFVRITNDKFTKVEKLIVR